MLQVQKKMLAGLALQLWHVQPLRGSLRAERWPTVAPDLALAAYQLLVGHAEAVESSCAAEYPPVTQAVEHRVFGTLPFPCPPGDGSSCSRPTPWAPPALPAEQEDI